MQKAWFHIKNIIVIIIGSFILSVAVMYFAVPNQLGEGGITGIALLIYYFYGFSPPLVIWIINVPLLILTYKQFGKKNFAYTLIGIIFVTFFLKVTETWGHKMNDLLLASLYTGLLAGLGVGLIFRVGGTTGGTDIIARLTNRYLGWSFGRTFFIIDVIVITASIFIIGLDMAMYTIVAVFVGARMVDLVVEGLNSSKAVTIISKPSSQLADIISVEMDLGVTILEGKGGFSQKEKQVLYVVVNPTDLPKLKHTVREEDPSAFIVVHDVRDVYGRGFALE